MAGSEREIIRELAKQILELSQQPIMERRIARLTDHNSLIPGTPVILTSPEGAWGELLTDADLVCADPFYRGMEYGLRMRLFWANQIGDDTAVTADYNIGWFVNQSGFGVNIPYTHGANRGSYVWQPPISDIGRDMAKLRFREMTVDREATLSYKAKVEETLGDILKVSIRGGYWWTGGLTADAIRLLGLEQFMFAMCDDSEGLHALMKWLSDEFLNYISWFEREGLLNLNNHNDMIASGGYGFTRELPTGSYAGVARLQDLWGFAESQETVGISPEMFGEYIFPYQQPIFEKYGLNCYGCCEPVESRWKWLSTIPRLRRLSISPWSNQEAVAPMLGKDVIFSRKPNPALVCVGFEEEAIKADLERTVKLAKANGNNLEIILKDTHTVQGDKTRFKRWVELARSVVERYY